MALVQQLVEEQGAAEAVVEALKRVRVVVWGDADISIRAGAGSLVLGKEYFKPYCSSMLCFAVALSSLNQKMGFIAVLVGKAIG
jgi:hypothetical protein